MKSIERIRASSENPNPHALGEGEDIYEWSMHGRRVKFHEWNEEHWDELPDGNVWKELLRPGMEESFIEVEVETKELGDTKMTLSRASALKLHRLIGETLQKET